MIRGFFITLTAIRRQLAAMPSELYLVRPIHGLTGRPCPGERLWSAGLLTMGPAVGFLRARNREGFDIYLSPFAIDRNAGYILVDLDRADPRVVHTMRTHGHEPCVVLQTSPGNLQAWVHVSATPLEPAWPPKLAESWRVSIEAIRPASTGAIWVGSPASPIKNRSVAGPAALTLPGSNCCMPKLAWPHTAPRW